LIANTDENSGVGKRLNAFLYYASSMCSERLASAAFQALGAALEEQKQLKLPD